MAEPRCPEPSPDLPPENTGHQPPGPPDEISPAGPPDDVTPAGPAGRPGGARGFGATGERPGATGGPGGPAGLGAPGGLDTPGGLGIPGGPDGPAGSGDETERAFLEIIARFGDRPTEATWPPAEDLGLPPHPPVVVVRPARSPRPSGDPDEPTDTDLRVIGGPDDGPDGPAVERPVAGTVEVGSGPGLGSPAVGPSLGTGGDEHYEPPPAPPAPRLRPGTRAALACVALGVVLLVAPALTAAIDPTLSLETVAVLLVLGGVGTLVARMRDHGDRDPGDGPDDGAVV